MRKLGNILLLMTALLAAVSCIYDFNPDLQGRGGVLVVEGDILIGDFTVVRISRSMDLTTDVTAGRHFEHVSASCFVEASDGTVYGNGSSRIDTRPADPSLEYRLVVRTETGEYVSEWARPLRASAIDSLSYSISPDATTMWVEVSAHGERDNIYYRWIGEETWEYHAPFHATHYFVPRGTIHKGEVMPRDTVVAYEHGEDAYFCWRSGVVNSVLVASTGDLSENRLVRHRLYSMDRYDQKISYLYSVDLTQEALSEAAYKYWTLLEKNSNDVGGLFSPEPMEMRGNIVNVNDPEEMVLGYVSVTVPARTRYFIISHDTSFPRTRRSDYDYEPVYVLKKDWRRYYSNNYDVYMEHNADDPGRDQQANDEFDWLPARCVKCWLWSSGTKNKPSYWPNDDK